LGCPCRSILGETLKSSAIGFPRRASSEMEGENQIGLLQWLFLRIPVLVWTLGKPGHPLYFIQKISGTCYYVGSMRAKEWLLR
jgi:hypothetical protein